MLIVANGAYKSGSTWLYFILKLLTGHGPVPDEFQNPTWKHPSIHPDRLAEFLASGAHRRGDFLVKQHFDFSKRRLYEVVRPHLDGHLAVFDIKRDVRDAVVSAYHHALRNGDPWRSFRSWYWLVGRDHHRAIRAYHGGFERLAGEAPLATAVSYEGLKTDFGAEVARLCDVLKIAPGPDEVRRLEEKTSLDSMRKTYDEQTVVHGKEFFRKGKVGDYARHYSRLMGRDYREIEGRTGVKLLSPLLAVVPRRLFARCYVFLGKRIRRRRSRSG